MDAHQPCRGQHTFYALHTNMDYTLNHVLGLHLLLQKKKKEERKHLSNGCEGERKNREFQIADIDTHNPPPILVFPLSHENSELV